MTSRLWGRVAALAVGRWRLGVVGVPEQRGPRRRRENVAGGRVVAHQVRVSPEEEAQLLALCAAHGGISVPRLLVESALSAGPVTGALRRRGLEALLGIERELSVAVAELREARDAGAPVAVWESWIAELAAPGGRLSRALDDVAVSA